ncbi:hypothetical protein [Jannaschia sp. M317]|uniref:hypothetical protein n=1 Tax=Jannaschia sp. M317 TaxID=2867011 RepID=UPI0021A3850F|nr:hypothetical protein [Jannaschia sp. M317]UWQ17086.1 hypothetical protein K3551_14495 [Jannaschia sp. M317]
MLTALDDTSLAYIVLSRWLPGLITVVAGGYMASILFPKLQRSALRASQVEEKKIEIAEQIVQGFNRYIVSWRRLIQISNLETMRALTTEEQDRKMGFVTERNARRDDLLDKLKLCQLYFCETSCSEIERFVAWDEGQSTKPLEDLPDLEDWRRHERTITGLIKNEIS